MQCVWWYLWKLACLGYPVWYMYFQTTSLIEKYIHVTYTIVLVKKNLKILYNCLKSPSIHYIFSRLWPAHAHTPCHPAPYTHNLLAFVDLEHPPARACEEKRPQKSELELLTTLPHQLEEPVCHQGFSRMLGLWDSGVLWPGSWWLDALCGYPALWCQRDRANQNAPCYQDSHQRSWVKQEWWVRLKLRFMAYPSYCSMAHQCYCDVNFPVVPPFQPHTYYQSGIWTFIKPVADWVLTLGMLIF